VEVGGLSGKFTRFVRELSGSSMLFRDEIRVLRIKIMPHLFSTLLFMFGSHLRVAVVVALSSLRPIQHLEGY